MTTALAILMGVSLVLGIIGTLAGVGSTIWSTSLAALNQNVKATIQNLATKVSKWLSSNRSALNQAIAAVNSRQAARMQQFLMTNPVISKTMSDIEGDQVTLAKIQANQTSLENDISTLLGQLNSIGYSQSHSGVTREKQKVQEIERELEGKRNQYNDLNRQIETTQTNARSTKVYTDDLDAISQNVKGGLNA